MIARCLFILLLCCLGAHAQSIRIEERLSSDTVYIGDVVTLEIAVTVDRSIQIDEPVIPSSPDYEIRSAGTSTSTQSILGNTQMTQRFRYRVRPSRLGRLSIPSTTVRVGSEERRSKPVLFDVVEPEQTDAFDFVLEPESTSVYVGQPVRVRLAWYLYQSSVRGYEMIATIPDSVEIYPIDPRQSRRGAQVADMRLNGQNLIAWVEENSQYDGRRAMGVFLEVTIVPREAGPLRLDSFAVVADILVNSGSRLRGSQVQKAIARAAPIEFDVRPLPTQGRPETFEGLIGEFEVSTDSDRDEVNVGDPIELRVTVKGPEPLQRINAPDLTKQAGFDAFKLSSEGWKDVLTTEAGERVFRMTIRARNDAVREIPSIEIPHFDPTTGRYAIARSRPIPLNVRETKLVGIDDAIGGGGAVRRYTLENVEAGLPANVAQDEFSSRRTPLDGSSPFVMALLVVPPTGWGVVAAWTALSRWRDPVRTRRRRAFREATRRLRTSDPDAVPDAFLHYLAATWNLPERSITSRECLERLRFFTRFDEVRDLLSGSDRARWGRGEAPAPSTTDAMTLLRDLHREIPA